MPYHSQNRKASRPFPLKLTLYNVLCPFLLLVPILTGLAACGSNDSGKIQLVLWYWDGAIDDKLINQVDTVFPNVHLVAEKISDFDDKLRTSMAAQNGVPDITSINSNIATYFPDEDQFYDLQTLGANDLQSQYLSWKWNLGIAPDGKMIGFPMDTGPIALFYRTDLFAKAGLPTDPQQVSERIKTWDDYLQAGEQLKKATNGKVYMIDTISTIYNYMVSQNPKQYFDKTTGQYIGDQPYMRQMWDETVKADQMQITAKVQDQSWNQAISNGLVASFVGAVWRKQDLATGAPDTSGKWHIARSPGGDGNYGGSFLAISKYCQHPQEAFAVIKWLQSPQNQVTAYKDIQLYPSALDALSDPKMHSSEAFYGGQDTTQIFADAAKNVPTMYMGPDDGTVSSPFYDQLKLVEFENKNPEQAWNDAQVKARRELTL
jgi:cellobiose transport system substrate-binding protein